MGNNNSNTIDTYHHPCLGLIKRIQQQNKSQQIAYEVILENQKIYDDWAKELRYIKGQGQTDEILFLPIDHSFKLTSYCGTGGYALMRYEDYLYSLYPEIANRREIKRPFNQQELLYLFYNLIKIQAILESKNRVIGDVKPENILVNQDGYIKIISQFSWPGKTNRSISRWDKTNQRILLSPEEIQQRYKKKQTIIDELQNNASEVFSIGLTILEAGSLMDISVVYGQTSQYRFNEVKVRQFLDIFESRYSKQLSQLVKQTLHPSPKKRWKASYIYQLLKAYEFQILNLEEIIIRFDKIRSTPRIEREEKISIKRIGQSHYSQQDNESAKFNLPVEIPKNPRLSVKMKQKGYTYDGTSFPNENRQQNGSRNNVYQTYQHNHIFKNQYSSFERPLNPNISNQINSPQTILDARGKMAASLPLNVTQYQQMKQSTPKYLTQNSMMPAINREISQSNYFGNEYNSYKYS